MFPIEELRQAVETARRILTQEKIDWQLAGQTSLIPFINIKDGYTSKKVTFDTQDSLDEKIDRLTSLMRKMKAQDDNHVTQFKTKIYQSKRRAETRNFYDKNYGQRSRYGSNSGDRRISLSGRIQYGQTSGDRSMYNQNYRGDFRSRNFRGNIKTNQSYHGQTYKTRYRWNYRNDNYEWGRRISREGQYSDDRRNKRSDSRSRSGLKASMNRDRIRCYKCREYDHFAKDCLTSKDKESEQTQQM